MKKRRIFTLLIALGIVFLDIYVNKAYAIDEETYTNYTELKEVSCGNITGIPSILPKTLSIVYVLIQIAIPVVLVIIGMIDLFKGVTAQKEDDIKKAQGMFVKRLISAALVFFVLAIVKFLISVVTKNSESITRCLDCFISNNCVTDKTAQIIDKNKITDYKEWECTLDNYTFTFYKASNNRYDIAPTLRDQGVNSYYTDFKPTTGGACPTSEEYEAYVDDDAFYVVKK